MTPRAPRDKPALPADEAHDYRVFIYTAERPGAPPSMEGYDLRIWSPSWRRLVPPTMGLRAVEWWLWARLSRRGMRDYRVLLLYDGGRMVHRSCAIPACPRWRFVGPRDLHVCMTWTDPAYRGRGLATLVLTALVSTMAASGRRFWYLARPQNAASIAVCTKAGFVPHGLASYRRVLGLPLQIVPNVHPGQTAPTAGDGLLIATAGAGYAEGEEEVTPA